jgi:exodeoxyribonuclease VII small subunit
MPATHPPALPDDLKFETALAELESLVAQMEGGKLELEDSLAAYQRGMALARHCQGLLERAEERIQTMEEGVARNLPLEEKD